MYNAHVHTCIYIVHVHVHVHVHVDLQKYMYSTALHKYEETIPVKFPVRGNMHFVPNEQHHDNRPEIMLLQEFHQEMNHTLCSATVYHTHFTPLLP